MNLFHKSPEDKEIGLGNYAIKDWVKNDPMRPWAEVPREVASNITEDKLMAVLKLNSQEKLPPMTPGSNKRAYYKLVSIDEYSNLNELSKRTYLNIAEIETVTVEDYNRDGSIKKSEILSLKPLAPEIMIEHTTDTTK
jgi:hypothetical protein